MNDTNGIQNYSWILDGNYTEENETKSSEVNVYHICLDVMSLYVTYGSIFFMGCEVKFSQIREALKFWRYIIVGLAGQFLLMPLCGFSSIKLLDIQGYNAAGITIVTCSPGGGYSNLLTYLVDGEVWLSVVLTTLSSLLSFGVMPLNLWLYGSSDHLSVPYVQMLIALVLLNVALFFGMLVKEKAPKTAKFVAGLGGVSVVTVCCIWVGVWTWLNINFFSTITWKLSLAVVIVVGTGLVSISIVARLLRFPGSIVKTVAIETSYQSIGTALTVSILSFNREVVMKVQGYVFLYAISTTVVGVILGVFFQGVKKLKYCTNLLVVEEREYSKVIANESSANGVNICEKM